MAQRAFIKALTGVDVQTTCYVDVQTNTMPMGCGLMRGTTAECGVTIILKAK